MIKYTNPHSITAVILAAGSGSRMGADTTKQRMSLFGESVLHRSVRIFSSCEKISGIVVVCKADELDWAGEELSSFSKIYTIVSGGKTRAESAKIGFNSIPSETEYVAIHDGARCLITEKNIAAVIDGAIEHGAASAGTYIIDTIKQLDGKMIGATLPRDSLFAAHTPQVFRCSLYREALQNLASSENITDDNMLIEALGAHIYPVDTGKNNIKLTTPEDMAYAEYIIERRANMDIRVGHGYDVHRLTEGRRLILGGVDIPHSKGLLGHSDADALTHAVMDALLGAAGLGDIGRYFPDSDDSYKDISSLHLLKNVMDILTNQGYSIINIDATLVIQSPKIAEYMDKMAANIAEILRIEQGRVNIKATTEEHLGFTGREEGVSAHAVAAIKKG